MSLNAFLVTAFLETIALGPRVMDCTFPSDRPGERPISVAVESRPSLMDRFDRFRVRLRLDPETEVAGLAQPIDRTDDRDVLIRARASSRTIYTIGLRDDGHASLNLMDVRTKREVEHRETRKGACRDFENTLDLWLSY